MLLGLKIDSLEDVWIFIVLIAVPVIFISVGVFGRVQTAIVGDPIDNERKLSYPSAVGAEFMFYSFLGSSMKYGNNLNPNEWVMYIHLSYTARNGTKQVVKRELSTRFFDPNLKPGSRVLIKPHKDLHHIFRFSQEEMNSRSSFESYYSTNKFLVEIVGVELFGSEYYIHYKYDSLGEYQEGFCQLLNSDYFNKKEELIGKKIAAEYIPSNKKLNRLITNARNADWFLKKK